MRRMSLILLASLLFAALPACSQDPTDVPHARDFGAREMISSIFISPLPNAPFQATVTAEWTKYLPDGSTFTRRNRRLVVRDGKGRIYQERRQLVTGATMRQSMLVRIEISDPVAHTKYFCEPDLSSCELRSYDIPADALVAQPEEFDTNRPINRVSLGTKVIDGLETNGTRESAALPYDPNSSKTSLEYTKEFWYSKQLGLNLQVTRLDPLHGDQFFTVTDLKLSEPDPRMFVLPATTKITDLRTPPASAKSAPAQ
jgi:hypothetical protein